MGIVPGVSIRVRRGGMGRAIKSSLDAVGFFAAGKLTPGGEEAERRGGIALEADGLDSGRFTSGVSLLVGRAFLAGIDCIFST